MHYVNLLSRFILLIVIILPCIALGEVRIDGYFIARDSCPALQSIRRGTNPGDIYLIEDMAYEVISKNRPDATHYRLRVKNASPQERWVEISCGMLLDNCSESINSNPGEVNGNSGDGQPAAGDDYLLALSWQPAFCQTHQRKRECETQHEGRFDATHLTLHGLWPQPRQNIYCGVPENHKDLDENGDWERLPPLELSDDMMSELIEIMPGVFSFLHRHEWVKHGTCYSETPEEYYAESMMLVSAVNNSVVQDFLAENIGETVTAAQIKSKFDEAFGEGAGDKVYVECKSGMIVELRINLKGEINAETNIRDLLEHAESADNSTCSGHVDRVGF